MPQVQVSSKLEKVAKNIYMTGDIEVVFNIDGCFILGQSTMMKKTLSCAMPVVSANMPDLTSCCMLNHAVLWIPLRMRKTGKR